MASHEVIGNALQHARPPCRVRAWRSAGVFHVRVDDGGPGTGVATAGYGPPATPASLGMGLWVARQLTDVVHPGPALPSARRWNSSSGDRPVLTA